MKKLFIIINLIFYISCAKYNTELTKALKLSGNNRGELENTLRYFENKGNQEQLEAAKFLIANLPHNFSYDTTNLYKYRVIPNMTDSLRAIGKDILVPSVLNRHWDSIKYTLYENIFSKPIINDIDVIKSTFLISNIENAYNSWKRNPYSKGNISFEDFCEYILPYRLEQGYAIENWRDFFKTHTKVHFSSLYPLPFNKAFDSVFKQYADFKFDFHFIRGFPNLKFEDFMKTRRGNCSVKSWLNEYILNSEGIATASDFVPAWGHDVGGHQWTSIIYSAKTLYCDPYFVGEPSLHSNINIYNNTTDYSVFGKIRLPKVYRQLYSNHIDGPVADPRVPDVDVPDLFKNLKMKDVSEQYFETVDVKVVLPDDAPKGSYYAYLCVLGHEKTWVPVQWGKIDNGQVVFRKMGKDILYQPVFYIDGEIRPFGETFFLTPSGKKVLYHLEKGTQDIVLKYKTPPKSIFLNEARRINGAFVQASNSSTFKNYITLKEIDFYPELRPYEFDLKKKHKYRYFRIRHSDMRIQKFSYLPDQGLLNIKLTGDKKDTNANDIIDLGRSSTISSVSITPRSHVNHVMKGLLYELFYIDRGNFVSLGKQKAETYELEFKNLPKGRLFYLECLDPSYWIERPFEYKNSKQIWH